MSAQYLGWCRTVLKPSLLTWWKRWEKIWMVRLALSLLRLSSDITELSTEIIPETENWFVSYTILFSPAQALVSEVASSAIMWGMTSPSSCSRSLTSCWKLALTP